MRANALVLLVALGGGCNVFDPALFRQRQDGGADGGTPGVLPTIALADRCSGAVPEVVSGTNALLDTTNLANDFSDLAVCTGRALPGNDGFFRVRMNAGEQWHFHVRVQGGGAPDPAIYVLPGCDERSCAGGLDECGQSRDEHMSFRASASREYLVGVDSARPGGARYELIALRAECGNNTREHGESCEDGNRTPGDGCDERCRAELSGPEATEVEPNDDFTDPNVLMFPAAGGTLTARGRLGGRCDFDMYAVNVPPGASVRATMLDVNGMACGPSEPEYRMAWVLPDGRAEGGLGVVRMDNRCPAISEGEAFAQRIATGGTYYLRVTTARDEATGRDYRLRVELLR